MSVSPVRGKCELKASNGDGESKTSISNCKQIWRVTCAACWFYKFVLHLAWLEAGMTHSVATALRAELSRNRISIPGKDFSLLCGIQTGSDARTASFPMDTYLRCPD